MKKQLQIVLCILILLPLSACSQDKVFDFPKEQVQSFSVLTYDTKDNTTTSNWVYKEEDMADFLDYLENLSGTKVDALDLTALSSLLYGVELNVDYPYTILFIGDYAINYEGEYYKIDGNKAAKMCQSIIGNTDVYDGTPYIINHRYLSLLGGSWDTTYMTKSTWTGAPLADATMSVAEPSLEDTAERLGITITNNTGGTLEYGSRIILEAQVDDVWYNIDNMLNDNINIVWTEELRMLDSGTSTEDSFYLAYHQPLPAGDYRLIKEFRVNDINGYLSSEFVVK